MQIERPNTVKHNGIAALAAVFSNRVVCCVIVLLPSRIRHIVLRPVYRTNPCIVLRHLLLNLLTQRPLSIGAADAELIIYTRYLVCDVLRLKSLESSVVS